MGCCWPKSLPAFLEKQGAKPWYEKYSHTEPLNEEDKESARLAYKSFLVEKQKEFKSKLKNDCPNEDATNFRVSGALAEGSFGIVTLAEHKRNGRFFAVEIVRKKDVLAKETRSRLIREKNLLFATLNDYVVELVSICKTRKELYMVMELSHYGDFRRAVLAKKSLDEPTAKLFAAQVLLAVEYLHSCHILHRDLKPENLLVFLDGYLKLTDFSCAKVVPRSTATFAGTPDKRAPEVIKRQMYSKGVDWWAFGIFIFEMLSNELPFPPDDVREGRQCEERIVRDPVLFKGDFSEDAKDLITKLLEKKPHERLGNLKGGADDIKDHPWFGDINFIGIFRKKYDIDFRFDPFVPTGLPKDLGDSSGSSFESLFRDF